MSRIVASIDRREESLVIIPILILICAVINAVATAAEHKPPWPVVALYWGLVTVYWLTKLFDV